MTTKRILDAAKRLHWRHGVGDIKRIQVYANGRIEITAQRTSFKPHVRRGRVINSEKGTVRMYGHQLTIKEGT